MPRMEGLNIMTIASSTSIQAYQLRAGGSRARMAILRMIAADSVSNRNEATRLQPGDWRGARKTDLRTYANYYGAGLNAGKYGTEEIWYCHHDAPSHFRKVNDAHDVVRMGHTGHYTDVYSEGLAIGIVAYLSHGRFIAGYRWTENDEHVFFGEVFTGECEAARMADEHARVFAENSRDDSQRAQQATELQTDIEDSLQRLRECLALRHRACMQYVRDEISDLIEKIREAREELDSNYAQYV